MSLIAQADFEAFADSIAAQIVEGLKEFDNDGVLATSYTLGANNNITRALALGDAEQEGALINPARSSFNASKAYPLLYTPPTALIRALGVHARSYNLNGVDGYLTSIGTRVAPEFNDAFLAAYSQYLSAANVWPPIQSDMGVFDSTGVGVGVFTDGTAIDSTRYGGADIVFENTTAAMGAINGTYTFTLTKFDGSSDVKVVAAAGLAFGAQLDIGVHGVDRYVDVNNITVAGGVNLDQITVRSHADRAIAL